MLICYILYIKDIVRFFQQPNLEVHRPGLGNLKQIPAIKIKFMVTSIQSLLIIGACEAALSDIVTLFPLLSSTVYTAYHMLPGSERWKLQLKRRKECFE